MTMLSDQRTFKRFDVYAVGEFNSPGKPSESFLGITRNFSCGGLSFESQNFNPGPGDTIELKFRDPDQDVMVSSTGEIVWKRNSSKFDCVTGIRFKDTTDFTESKLLKIMSANGKIPVDDFLPDPWTEGEKRNGEGGPSGKLITEDVISYRETPGSEGGFLDSSGDHNGAESAEESGVDHDDIRDEEGSLARKNWLYGVVIAVAAVSLIFMFNIWRGSIKEDHDNKLGELSQPPETDNIQLPPVIDDVQIKDPFLPKKPDVGITEKSGKKRTVNPTKQRRAPGLKGISAGSGKAGGKEYYIQVGAWKNSAYAMNSLKKLKKFYPEAHIVQNKGFQKIVIPNITNESQGKKIIKDIQQKLNITPLLVSKQRKKR